jgi:hypothetical protein
MSIEQSMDVDATSSNGRRNSRKPLPDLRDDRGRVVPGMDVARLDATTWNISARGFNTQNADKVLVLIDGRRFTIHCSPVSPGMRRTFLIRGPGSSLWGLTLSTASVWRLLSVDVSSHEWHVEPVAVPALQSNGSILTHATL